MGSPSTQVRSPQAHQAAWLQPLQQGLETELGVAGLSCHQPRLAGKLSAKDLLCEPCEPCYVSMPEDTGQLSALELRPLMRTPDDLGAGFGASGGSRGL